MRATPRRLLFVALGLATLLPGVTPALALGLGLLFGLSLGSPWPGGLARGANLLLKISVVGLGFGMSLGSVLAAGAQGLWVTAAAIALALGAGLLLGRFLRVERVTGQLISVGTAICGGSAIAAVGPVLGASRRAMAVALATVFVLNGVALYVFPPLGEFLGLSQEQFAIWSAVAIHDTSSVVGAAASYGQEALATATVLKLVRALWILPLTLLALWWARPAGGDADGRLRLPWFIGLFLLAAALRALLPGIEPFWDDAYALARRTLVLTLFLIGAGLSRETLRALGPRPVLQGVLLWLLMGGASLGAVWAWV